MKKMQIFEPAMCCSTGLCGVGVDQELLRISTVLNAMEKNGVKVERFNLSNAPQEFIMNKVVNNFVQANGIDGLPITVVDDEIVITGRYPETEEFAQLLDIPTNHVSEQTGGHPKVAKATITKKGGCGCSDGSCC
jgi:hypothetical protein